MSEKIQVALLKKKSLPWLKRLQGDLDDDDSSDSCSLSTDVTPKKVKEEEPKTVRVKKKRPLPLKSENSDDASTEGSGDKKMKKRGLMKKPVIRRRKQVKGEGSQVETSIATAAKGSKGKRVGQLGASRATNDRNENISAIKQKREVLAKGVKSLKSRSRASRPAQKTSAVDADVEDEGEPRRQRKVQAVASKEGMKFKNKLETSTKTDSETDPVDSHSRVTDRVSESTPDGKCGMVPAEVTKAVDVDVKHHDAKTKMISPAKPEFEDASKAITPAKEGDNLPIPRKTEEGELLALSPSAPSLVIPKRTFTKTDVGFKATRQAKPEVEDASKVITPAKEGDNLSTSRKTEEGGLLAPSPSAPSFVIPKRTFTKTDVGFKATGQTKPEIEDASKVTTPAKEDDNLPIPRKTEEGGSLAPSPSAPSFVIPKRTFTKTDVGFKATGQAGRAVPRSSPFKCALDPPGGVKVPPQPSPQSSPMVEFIPPQRKRTKNPVPVKNIPLSPHDRALMRLSRKRNSIFMAAVELGALSTDTMGNKKVVSGYEVCDVEGKTLSDLIPRLTCATKRKMASDRESFTASFFGVSCLAPQAKGESSSSVVGECGTNEVGARKINCYEELRFERPEDREFYQRKMYGTTFVPQNVRGRITLIVRNARFERKSTGIRFNQDRDREEFAAAMSKRYTFKKSVPRCDIPRENWQRLMRNQPGTVYLHYYNREDAERASQIFGDDDGQLLQIRLELKAGVRITANYSSASGFRMEHTPRRSCSSERGALEPSPLSSQHGSARNTPLWRRDRPSASRTDKNSRYDRGTPPRSARWQRGEDRYGPSVSGNKRLRERRSRSRSRPESFQRQRDDSYGRAGSETESVIKPPGADRVDGSNINDVNTTSSPAHNLCHKRSRTAPLSPQRSPTSVQGSCGGEKKAEGGLSDAGRVLDTGEKKSNSEFTLSSPVGNSDVVGGTKEQQRGRSPPRRWHQVPHNASQHPRRGSFYDNRPTESAQYRSSQQQQSRNSSTQRPRSRSRSKTFSPGRRGNYGGGYKERRSPRDYGRRGSYDNNGRMHDRGRGGYNNRGGGANSRQRQ